MKQSELFFSFLLVPLDFLMIILAGTSAYYLRFASLATEIRPVIFSLPFGGYFQIVLLIALAWLVIFAFTGLYNIKGSRRLTAEIYRVILACSTGLMLIVIMIFVFRELFSSRFIVLAGWLLAIIYISFARIVIRSVQRTLLKHGIGVHKIVLVGNSNTTDVLMHEFSSQKRSGYEIIKRLKNFSLEAGEDLAEFIKTNKVDEIIQSIKRIFDIILALFLIIIFSPILIIAAIIIKLDSRGPVIYKNERVSKNGIFKLFKFRSMIYQYCVGDEYGNNRAMELEKKLIEEKNTKSGPVYKIGDDPRLTGVGKFIRRWSIDELPQFFNILKGDMSLVGPRPHQPREVAKYEHHHKKVLSIKPGLTGLAQISGRSDLSFEDEVKLDIYYIENWSLLFDIAIILRTPLAVIRGRKVE
ncbi:sugar transferase [Candidatus Falkowbacteria bacterium]|nr:sugar transferase [Candidatus Falkowbacteria bacterium]